jgi:hypothetical protein
MAGHDESDCQWIEDGDLKYYCQAVAGHDESDCQWIQGADTKQVCEAVAGS